MRNISAAYRDAALSTTTEPVFVAKIINATNTIYVTTRQITIDDPGSIQLQGVIEEDGANFSSQSIKPEEGISTIGGATVKIIDRARAFTDELNAINDADDSLFNDRVELYVGFANIDFDDYVLWTPLYVESFNNDEITYTLKLSDTQRISKKSLFADLHMTELVGNYGYENTSTLEVISPAGFLTNSGIAALNSIPSGESKAPEGYSQTVWDPSPVAIVIASADIGDRIVFGWTAEYARRMEYGFQGADSLGREYNQTGYAFMRTAANRWTAIVNETIADVKQKVTK